MATQIWAVRAALFQFLTELVGTDAVVIDGPVAQTGMPKACVLVGTDGGGAGTGEGSAEGFRYQQVWSDSAGGRDEQGEIVCSVWAWSGDSDLTPQRLVVEELVDRIESALLADKTLGGTITGYVEVTSGAGREVQQASSGSHVRHALTITYLAYLRSTP